MAKSKFLKKLDKINYESIIYILGIAIVLIFIINLFFAMSLTSVLKQKIAEAEEAAKPANLELTIITTQCQDCFNINSVIEGIKSENVNVTKEETLDVGDASQLIQDYNIERLPTVIVKGELNKTNLDSTLTAVGDALVFTSQTPPYYDVSLSRVKGLIVATVINASGCGSCTDVAPLLDELKSNGIIIARETTLTEEEAAGLIETYNMQALPSLILSRDASEYQLLVQNWPALGTIEQDGNFVLRDIPPPYKNTTTGAIEGLVTLTNVIDSSCTACYNVDGYKPIIENFGVYLVNETTFDVTTQEGLAYANTNNITLVPTIVLSSDAKKYQRFYDVFRRVSQETKSGDLVFTAVEDIGTYKNIQTGEIIEQQEA